MEREEREDRERMVRPAEAIQRLSISKSTFWQQYVNTGRVRLRRLGAKAVGFPESELLALIKDLPVRAEAGNPGSEALRLQRAAAAEASEVKRSRSPGKRSNERGFNQTQRKAEREAVQGELRKLRKAGVNK